MTTASDLTDLTGMPPLLLPRPRVLHRWEGWHTLPPVIRINGFPDYIELAITLLSLHAPVEWATPDDHGPLCVDGDAPNPPLAGDEAYRLHISATRIHLSANQRSGIRHGLHTLAQLLVQYGQRLPCLDIEDAPAFAVRGVMLDISRDRVPSMAHLLAMIDQLASWKINHLQFYTEHTFAYAGHEDVWRDASPLSADEVRHLDAHCRSRGIELAANQNCFGHLASWLQHPQYAPLAEIAPGGVWDFNGLVTRTGPFSLCPGDPRSLQLIDDLLKQLLPTISGPLVNIGCDETFDVGQGRSRDAVARHGRATVYLDFVRQVCALVRQHGKRPMFWADIALEHPEALNELPDDIIGLAWGYEPDAPFARWCQQLRQAGREVWVCPGTSCWRSITGRTHERRANLLAAARDGIAHGATGYLVTAWGDLGHRQQWPITLYALTEAAHRAWSGEADYDVRATSLHAFADRSLGIGPWLDTFGDVDLDLRTSAGKVRPDGKPTPLRNATALFTDTNKGITEPWIGTSEDWQLVSDRLIRLADPQRDGAIFAQLSDKLLVRELLVSLSDAMLAANRAVGRRLATSKDQQAAMMRDLSSHCRALIKQHRSLWLARCRPGGLDKSCRHYEVLADEFAS